MTTGGAPLDEGPLALVRDALRSAVEARRCHACGCLSDTIETLARTEAGRSVLAHELDAARGVVTPRAYECLGCPVCHPAVAANAFAEAFPEEEIEIGCGATDAPAARQGWPPLPGDYQILRYQAPVALCTLGDDALAERIARIAPDGLAVVGTLRTENLGIERIIRNVLSNPHLRFLVVVGPDTQGAVGHLPGQSLVSLFHGGVDARGRILGARGKRPVLKNVSRQQVDAFRQQLELVARIGEVRDSEILACVREAAERDPGPFTEALSVPSVPVVPAELPSRLVPDEAGFFVVHPDHRRMLLVLEHFDTAGVLDCVIEGTTPAAVANTAIARNLLSRLDHAAYLGAELTRAAACLESGDRYVQDRAPGELASEAEPEHADARGCCCAGGKCGEAL